MKNLSQTKFKKGQIFIIDKDLKRGKLKAIKPKGFMNYTLVNALLPESVFQVSDISSIDKEGFNYYEYYLGEIIKGRVLFKNCFITEIDNTDLSILKSIKSKKINLKKVEHSK